jgi:hypothetical protein
MDPSADNPIVELKDFELKSCPFCGDAARTIRHNAYNFVSCVGCDCQGPASIDVEYAQYWWNCRCD